MYTDDQIRALIKERGEWLASAYARSELSSGPLLASMVRPDICPECGESTHDMDTDLRDMHVIAHGAVLIGCEGYHTPAFITAYRSWVVELDRIAAQTPR